MRQEAVNYIVVLPGMAHPIKGDFAELDKAEAHAADLVSQGSPEAHVYKRVGCVKRTSVQYEWVPVKVPKNLGEWLNTESKEIK